MNTTSGIVRVLGMAMAVACALLTGGCSYAEQFFLVNSSSIPVEVVAFAEVYPNVNTGERICSWKWQDLPAAPRAIAAAKLGTGLVRSEDTFAVSDLVFDETACSVRVKIGAGSALLIWNSSNGRWRRGEFLEKIVLGNGAQVIQGAEVAQEFHKKSEAIYVLEYKGSKSQVGHLCGRPCDSPQPTS